MWGCLVSVKLGRVMRSAPARYSGFWSKPDCRRCPQSPRRFSEVAGRTTRIMSAAFCACVAAGTIIFESDLRILIQLWR